MKFQTIYDRVSLCGIRNSKPSMTQQHFKDDCDVNRILERFLRTGSWTSSLNQLPSRQPVFGDFDTNFDFHQAQNTIVDAQRRFMTLPASVRERFHNSPGELISFLDDPANAAEAVKLGLLKKKDPVVSDPVVSDPVVSDPSGVNKGA